jgi:hypothetical protein
MVTTEQKRKYKREYMRMYSNTPTYKANKAAYDSKYRLEQQDKRRNNKLLYNYGINLEEYNKLFEKQNGVCAICLEPETAIDPRANRVKWLAVDHDDTTNIIRGLLCQKHNCGIGQFSHSAILLNIAIQYLQKPKPILQAFFGWQNPVGSSFRMCKKRYRLKETFGITIEEYLHLFKTQKEKCAICGYKPADDAFLCIDHDHQCCPNRKSCGKCIRGLLCQPCNGGLAFFVDNTSFLESAIAYLESA